MPLRPRSPTNPSLLLTLVDSLVGGLVSACRRLARAPETEVPAGPTAQLFPLGTSLDAVGTLNRTLAVQPHNCLAWFQLGMVHLHQGTLTEAVSAFERARSFGFDTFELHYYLAEALSGLGRHEESVAELYEAIDRKPDAAEPAYRLGLCLAQLDRHEEAAAAFKIAVSLSPNTVRYHQSLGLALESLGQRDEAIDCFKAAVSLERRLGQ